MTVSELREWLDNVDGSLEVVTEDYNDGYGGLFGAGVSVVKATFNNELGYYQQNIKDGEKTDVVAIGSSF